MNKFRLIVLFSLFFTIIFGQDYAPAAGVEGTTAIKYDSSVFVAWATGIELQRGLINIENYEAEYQGSSWATFGEAEDALGPATGSTTEGVVSLGDSGVAILTFDIPITNGEGWDFAIFENGVTDNFLELAFVEVSSDGEHFVRFPCHSQTQTETPIGGFGSIDPTYIHNFAGKYRVGYGTPFDLEELKDSSNLDVSRITHVKIVDVIGTLGEKATYDSYGNKVNDPFPTPFNSGGFDLAGVGVIHEWTETSGFLEEEEYQLRIYPNPSKGHVNIIADSNFDTVEISNQLGETIEIIALDKNIKSQTVDLPTGFYFLHFSGAGKSVVRKVVVE